MRAGTLRHRIRILSPRASTARSTDGAPVVSYSTALADVWARVEPVGVAESYRGDYRWSDADIRVTIRYTTVAIQPQDVIVFNSGTYQIQGVQNTEYRNRELVLLAVKST